MRAGGPVQLQPRHAGLDDREVVVRVQFEDAVEAGEVERDAAGDRDHVALQTRGGAEGRHRDASLVRPGEQRRDLGCPFGVDDGVGPVRRVVGEVARVLLEVRVADAHAPFVAEEGCELRAQVHVPDSITTA